MDTQESLILRLAGEFDAYNREELARLLFPARDNAQVVIDFTAARYVDSSCLAELASIRRARLDRGLPSVRLVIPNANMRKIFEIVGFDQVFPLFQTVEEAAQDPRADKRGPAVRELGQHLQVLNRPRRIRMHRIVQIHGHLQI